MPKGAAAASLLQPEQPHEPMEEPHIEPAEPCEPVADAEVEKAVAGYDAVV